MIKRENLQIYFNINSDQKLTEIILVDSSTTTYEEIHRLTDRLRLSHGNICGSWLVERTPESLFAKFLKQGFASKAIEEIAVSWFRQVEGMKDFLDHIYG